MISLSLKKQLDSLSVCEPSGHGQIANVNGRRLLRWNQVISPTYYSRQYEIRITYSYVSSMPKAQIISPNPIELASGEVSPHDYALDGVCTPCLFYFNGAEIEWRPNMLISHSIIPWLSEWLYYWELWNQDGIWRGEGYHQNESTMSELKRKLKE